MTRRGGTLYFRYGSSPLLWTFAAGKRRGQKMIELDTETDCWIWQGGQKNGYGVLAVPRADVRSMRQGSKHSTRPGWWRTLTHQLFYFLRYGNPPRDTELGHTCHRRRCCNPKHVRPLSHQGNIQEMFFEPDLPAETTAAIEEAIMDDQPLATIADRYCLSSWAVKRIAQRIPAARWDAQDQPVPF